MTPEERALRDAWLSEMWKPVREWHQTFDEKAMSRARNELVAERPTSRKTVA